MSGVQVWERRHAKPPFSAHLRPFDPTLPHVPARKPVRFAPPRPERIYLLETVHGIRIKVLVAVDADDLDSYFIMVEHGMPNL